MSAVDLYNAPFVHITVTSPRPIGDVWAFAKTLKGNEWPEEEASAWGITVTGATEARTPVSQIENGLGTLMDVYQTVVNMGGPTKLKRVVAPLSTIFWLEGTDGKLWSIDTHERVYDEMYQEAKRVYDEILSGIEVSESGNLMQSAWAQEPALSPQASPDGAFDLVDLAGLRSDRTYEYTGSWTNPEHGQQTLIDRGGYAQKPKYYARQRLFKIGGCIFKGGEVDELGCGPAAFSALLAYHYKYRGAKVGPYTLKKTINFGGSPLTFGNASYEDFLHFMTEPTGSKSEPHIIEHMGSCRLFGGTATAAKGFTGGAKSFLKDHAPQFHLQYSWSRGLSNFLKVGSKVETLREAQRRNVPALVLYPSGGGGFHYSFIKEWGAEGRRGGLFITPDNHPSKSTNMGDTFSGEVGVWTIY